LNVNAGLDLAKARSVLIVGVGGPGMSAIAVVLAEMGHRVRGSDLHETPFLDHVRRCGVEVRLGHGPSNLDGIELVCISTAIRSSNPDVAEAQRRAIPVVRRGPVLSAICARTRAVGVAGTHGKTSTAAMLSLIAHEAGLSPGFIIGGQLHQLGVGARWGDGTLLVIEADESDGTFLELPLQGSVVTNVEVDHLDHFGTVDAMHQAFVQYMAGCGLPMVVCVDDPVLARLASIAPDRRSGVRSPLITYGTAETAQYRLTNLNVHGDGRQSFDVRVERDAGPVILGRFELPVRGIHMARNALGALAMALELGADVDSARRALADYGGVARRFDIRSRNFGVTLVDDYAHLPSEIAAVLAAASGSGDGWERVVAVFQPNRYSRMAVLSGDYRDAFVHADEVVIADIYPSGEPPLPGVTGQLVVDAVLAAHPGAAVSYCAERSELAATVAAMLLPGDVCISMGCGDVSGLPDEIEAELR
jgi:UDP-N-acetylmuramate--alanine ligase